MGRKSNADQRRREIVRALYDCLAEQGHEKVTIKTIAARAGLPPGVIHYYFKSKDAIIADLARLLVERYSQGIAKHLAAARTDQEEMTIALDYIVDELIFDDPLNRVFFNLIQMAYERKALHGVMTATFRTYRQRMADVLAAAGMGAASRPLGASLVAMAEGFSLQRMVEPDVFTKAEVKAALKRAIGPVSAS